MNFKKITAAVLSFMLVAGVMPVTDYAASASEEQAYTEASYDLSAYIAEGTCGENLIWTLDENGTLTISGTGEMTDWTLPHEVPWNDYDASITAVVIEEGVTSIGGDAFNSCAYLTSVTMPSTLKTIGSSFPFCYSLTSITIPSGVESVTASAFSYCDLLTEINVDPANEFLSSKDGVLFNKNKSQLIRYPEGKTGTSYTIPATVENIERSAFASCRRIASFEVEAGSEFLSAENGVLFNKAKTDLILYPKSKTDTEYTVPESVISIRAYAFEKCNRLQSIALPDTVESIGEWAFFDCTSLNSINIPSSLTAIAAGTFYDCDSLTEIEIPESITSIGGSAFAHCSQIQQITLPESVENIEAWAFYSCSKMNSVVIHNPDCAIDDTQFTFDEVTAIYGYTGSTAQTYAETYSRNFVALDAEIPEILYGDADLNGVVELNDAVKIMCWITDEANNPMTAEQIDAADVYQRGDGLNNMDALAIQKKLAQLIPELPESYLE